ncbi:4'-phosphopantetheinyl transferase superfamily protein [Arthrobacter sp. SX1312]|uniref:4'-phosphopantetheinyl transferase family protein n=1 Tax=Arthrobacter sp. SX1312 TaxID=2058896 RepID=UPI000CE4C8BF|nr:4'-phosphopantetheinyl transferase superfamily protein [Arthrobacter sp. SX1312]
MKRLPGTQAHGTQAHDPPVPGMPVTAADPGTPASSTPFPGLPTTAADPADPAGLPPGTVLRLRRIGPGSDLPPTTAMPRFLDDAERARAARTVDATQSASFIAGRYLLRELVADLLGTRAGLLVSCFQCPACGPDGVSDHGRPAYRLRGERVPLALSLSRAEGFVLLGALETLEGHGTAGMARTVGTLGTASTAGAASMVGTAGMARTVGTLGTAGTVSPAGTVGPVSTHNPHTARGTLETPASRGAGGTPRPGLGVDLATVAAVDFDGFDDVALTPGERRAVRELPTAERRTARARLWARKEALVKALGTGFADRGPDAVEVLRERSIIDLPSVGGEALEPLGLVAAVAVGP